MNLATPARILSKTILYLLGLALALVLVLILINLSDEDLRPETAALLVPPPASVPAGHNSFYALYALGVPAGQDPHAVGQEFLRERDALYAETYWVDPERLEALEARLQLKSLEFVRSREELCERGRRDCLKGYAAKRAEIARLESQNAVRLARYRALYAYPDFQETGVQRIDSVFPGLPYGEHQLALARIGLRVADGEAAGALRELARDTAYWRRVLANARTLITKLIATAALERNYYLLAETLYRHRGDAKTLVAARPLLAAMTDDERSYYEPLRSEARVSMELLMATGAGMLHDAPEFLELPKNWFAVATAALFYKRNASANRYAQYWQPVLEFGTTPASDLSAAAERLTPQHDTAADIFRADLVYNPVGKILVAIAAQQPQTWARYAARVHNLDGLMRLTSLQHQIYTQHLDARRVPSHLATTAPAHHDPYRDAPMHWDGERGELYFQGADRRGVTFALDQRVAIKVF